MLKAVLFDDEHIVLKGLMKLIVWSDCGVELVATAQDGITALAAFRKHKPAIVMTDIRMPGIDGLELIRTIREESPDTVCIVFSGYNEYTHVKKAISLGVIDYLEKPITLDKIREGIRKAVHRIHEQSEMTELKERRKREMMEKSTLDLLHMGESALPEWMEQFEEGADSIAAVTVLASSCEHFRMENGVSYFAVHLRNGGENLIVLFHLAPYREKWEKPPIAASGITVGSGRTYFTLGETPKSYKEALHALRYGRYLEGAGWVRFDELGDSDSIQPNVTEKEEELLFHLRLGDKQGFMEKLDGFLEEFKKGITDPDIAEMELLRLIFQCMETAKETGGNVAELFPQGYVPQKELRNTQTREGSSAWLRQELERIIDWVISIRLRSKHVAVEKAVKYMEEHYGNDLTQQEVAEHVDMNVTYFSLLFKEQMGLSYIKYLTNIRMEKAKQFLNEGMSIQAISERVGYYHARHFAEVFKKYTGLTPGQYRTKGNGA